METVDIEKMHVLFWQYQLRAAINVSNSNVVKFKWQIHFIATPFE